MAEFHNGIVHAASVRPHVLALLKREPNAVSRSSPSSVRWIAPPFAFERERLTNCTVDGVAGFRRLVAGGPSAGREFSDSIDRKIGQAREHRAEVVADR